MNKIAGILIFIVFILSACMPAATETPETQVSQTSAPHTEVEADLPSCFDESNDETLLASITGGY